MAQAGYNGYVPRWSGLRTTDENTLGRWVYTTYETGECEFCDLAADPWELDNRCNDAGSRYANVHTRLAAALNTLRRVPAGPQCTSTCYVDAFNGRDSYGGASPRHAKQHIQAAIDAVKPGGTIRVLPGHYREQATNRSPSSRAGSYNFGLFVPASKPSVSIIGVTYVDQPITNAASTQADITTIGDAKFGPVGVYVDAAHTTFQGLAINGNLDPATKTEDDGRTFDIVADDFTLKNSTTRVPAGGSIWFEDPNSAIRSYHVIGNLFLDGTTIDVTSHTGTAGNVSGREIKSNAFDLQGTARVGIDFDGLAANAPAFDGKVGGAVIANNSFTDTRTSIRSRGTVVNTEFDWSAWFDHNTFDNAVMVGPDPMADALTSYTDTCGSTNCPARDIGSTIQRQIDRAHAADTVLVNAGTYHESPTIWTSITLKSIDGRDATRIALDTDPSDVAALTIAARDATLDGFTIVGRDGTPARTAGTNIVISSGLHGVTLRNNRFEVGEINGATPNGDEGIGIVTTNTTAPSHFVGTLRISNNIFQPLHASAFRAWLVKPGVSNLTITGNTVTGTFDVTATVQAAAAIVSNNTIAGSGSSASIGTSGYPDPDHFGQTTFDGNDISGTSAGIVVSEANDVTITHNLIHDVTNGVVLSDPGELPPISWARRSTSTTTRSATRPASC